jgi:glycosyltransferase involved in cell wall biosynthesis
MRIAFDCQAFVLQSYGGVSRYFTRLAQGLLNLEQQVEIFAPLHCNNHLSEMPKGIVNGLYIKQFPPKTTRFFIPFNHILSRYKIAKWTPNIVHETYYSRVDMAPKGCKTVITVYDMIHELFPSQFPTHNKMLEIKRNAIERADHIICISESTKKDLMRLHGTPASKISVVYLGFDKFFEEEKKVLPALFGTKPFLLYVGSRGGYKNFSGFLKAVSKSKKLLNDFQLVAFGGGKLSSEEMTLISSLGFAANQVCQLGGDDVLLGSFYRNASAFVYPSLYEGFGIPPLEAMANLCPVISSNTSSMPEVIDNAAEFFNPNDLDSMRCAIENVVYSELRMADLRNKGLTRLSLFSWEKATAQTLRVYKRIQE